MQKRRRIELNFPSTTGDSDAAEESTWRNGKLSDWMLQLQDKTYPIHRFVFGQGPRCSSFLAKAFNAHAFGSAGKATTNLTDLIPWCCEGRIFETALDFAYSGKLEKCSAFDLVCLCRVGDALQMRALLDATVERLNQPETLLGEAAFDVVAALTQLGNTGESLQKQLQEAAAEAIALQFSDYTVDKLATLPTSFMEILLDRKDLKVIHEDDLFELVLKKASAAAHPEVSVRLWQKVRFGQLSPKALERAAKVKEIPPRLFAYILVGKSLGRFDPKLYDDLDYTSPDDEFQDLGEWLGAHHFFPRNHLHHLGGFNFLHLYGARQDREGMARLVEYGNGSALRSCMPSSRWASMNICAGSKGQPAWDSYDVVIMTDVTEVPQPVPRGVLSGLQNVIERGGGVIALSGTGDLEIQPVIKRDHSDFDPCECTLADPGNLCVCSPEHPIFRNFDPRAYVARGLVPQRPDFGVKEGARILAKLSGTDSPEIIESADSRVILFANLGLSPEWNPQVCHLLRNTVAHVTQSRV